jgi:hypothetical protein
MEKFKVESWRDYHGVETFFRVVDQYGDQYGVFASEWEAIAKAEALAVEASAEAAE